MRKHAKAILKKLYETKSKLTATDFNYISNPNQYFCELENAGLITSEWAKRGDAKIKLRYIANNQLKKAKQVLGAA